MEDYNKYKDMLQNGELYWNNYYFWNETSPPKVVLYRNDIDFNIVNDYFKLLETAIHKMTAQTASYLGIKDRGLIAAGKKADLVLFNPETVIDHAVIGNSNALSTGIQMVWVNGQLIYEDQKSTGFKPGVLIKR
jgi:N-acyl-D-aspartate/D-glutamate deacylase